MSEIPIKSEWRLVEQAHLTGKPKFEAMTTNATADETWVALNHAPYTGRVSVPVKFLEDVAAFIIDLRTQAQGRIAHGEQEGRRAAAEEGMRLCGQAVLELVERWNPKTAKANMRALGKSLQDIGGQDAG